LFKKKTLSRVFSGLCQPDEKISFYKKCGIKPMFLSFLRHAVTVSRLDRHGKNKRGGK
jgi:hypothetical protein